MAVDIRILGQSGIEDYHAHLMRLDRGSRFPGTDDRAIDAHCLALVAAGAILIGAYENGVMHAGAQIVPDRTARRAEAAITVESGFESRGFEHELTESVIDEARRYHLNDLRIHGQSATVDRHIPAQSYARAVNG